MAFSRADFVQQTTNTTGTGTYSLSGSVGGRQNFLDGNASGSTVRYSVTDGTNWEVSEGILTSGQITRATVIASSNSGAAISWASGDKFISQVLTASEVDDLATESYVDSAVAGIVDSAPAALDTLNELAAALGDDPNFATTTATSIGEKLAKASNLSDLTNAATARTNLGLGTAATTNSTAYATAAQGTLADSALQSGDNISLLTNNSGYITGNQTITLSGDVSGSGTTSIAVTIADDSHNHTIANVDGLQTALDGKVDDSQVLTNVPSGAVFTDTTYSVGNGGLTEINFTSALNSKLAGIEAGATADQTASEILTAIKTVDGSGSGLDADLLDGQQGSYYAPVSTLSNYLPLSGGTLTGNLSLGDNNKLRLGAGNDLEIYHNGTESIIADAGTGILKYTSLNNEQAAVVFEIENTSTGSSTGSFVSFKNQGATNPLKMGTVGNTFYLLSDTNQTLMYASDAGVGLRYAGSTKLQTTSTGATVTGTLYTSTAVSTDTHGNSQNWYDAYTWGNHASAGYASVSTLSNYLPLTGGDITGGLVISGSGNAGGLTTASQYHDSADNLILKGNASGISGIFFQSEKDGTNINHNSDFGFIQYHPYGTGTSGEEAELVIGVSNDATDHIILNAPSTTGLKFRAGASETDYTIWHSGNDGSGSGLDADLLDGQHASAFQPAGTYNTIIGTDTDINTSGSTIIDNIFVTDGVITSMGTRTLTAADIGAITGNQTITLTGDVSGSGTTSIAVTVADDSHNHIISNVDGLQTALDGKLSTSGKAADSNLLDGIDSGSFLRSDAADTKTSGDLSFSSNVSVRFGTGIQSEIYSNGTHTYWDTATTGNDIYFRAGTGSRFLMDMGTGDFHADGDVIAASTSVSDRRLKDDITNIEGALDKVSQLNGVNYTWKKTGKADTGLIAQEVQAVLPNIVKEVTQLDGEECLAITYAGVIGLLVESVKELKAEVEALKDGTA